MRDRGRRLFRSLRRGEEIACGVARCGVLCVWGDVGGAARRWREGQPAQLADADAGLMLMLAESVRASWISGRQAVKKRSRR
jgi:hypothetical protein